MDKNADDGKEYESFGWETTLEVVDVASQNIDTDDERRLKKLKRRSTGEGGGGKMERGRKEAKSKQKDKKNQELYTVTDIPD
jgi:hypothetical protein